MGQAKELESLVSDLNNKDAYVRANAAKDLGWMQNNIAIKPLIKAIDDRSGRVRELSLWALSNIAAVHPKSPELREGGPIFRKMLKDRDWYARRYAATLLGKIGSTKAIP